jgi:diguanylate cyclase (GGDEF)-like protein
VDERTFEVKAPIRNLLNLRREKSGTKDALSTAAPQGATPRRPTMNAIATETVIDSLRAENAQLRREVETLRAYRELAFKDPLTHLSNRRALDERLAQENMRAERHPEAAFSVLVVDLNDFKGINDTLGHAAGDAALVWVADFLERAVRDMDVVYRTGGDEFTILLPNTAPPERHRVRVRLEEQLAEEAQRAQTPVSLSIGGATWGWDGQEAMQLLMVADRAMYADKEIKKMLRPAA